MNQFDSVLKMYAESGLRTSEDWSLNGRDINTDAKPRVDTQHRGATLSLYSRDQTRHRERVR
jgi:hypothetical protein